MVGRHGRGEFLEDMVYTQQPPWIKPERGIPCQPLHCSQSWAGETGRHRTGRFFNLLVRWQAVTTDKVEYPSDNRVSNTGGVGCEIWMACGSLAFLPPGSSPIRGWRQMSSSLGAGLLAIQCHPCCLKNVTCPTVSLRIFYPAGWMLPSAS